MKKTKDATSLALGSCFVAGAVKQAGFETDYFDFNVALNEIQPAELTPHVASHWLADPEKFLALYHRREAVPLIDKWLDDLLALVPQKEYLAVCLSMDRRDVNNVVNKACFAFTLLLAQGLKRRFPVPVILGGQKTLHMMSKGFLQSVQNGIPAFPVDTIAPSQTYSSIGRYLKALAEGASPGELAQRGFFEKPDPFTETLGLVPNYSIRNRESLLMRPEDCVPAEVLAKHPRLREIEPFFIAPYKFSEGCPFTCAFCIDGSTRAYTQHRARKVVDVLVNSHAQGARHFAFYNNNINLNRHFLRDVGEGLREAGVKIQFSDSANVQNATEEFMGLLASMGCVKLWFGMDTMSERIATVIGKNLSRAKADRALAVAEAHGIWSCGNLIYNFPHESDEEFRALLDFLENSENLDGYDMNEFRLHDSAQYFLSPEQYGIRIVRSSDNGFVSTFDEVGGLSSEAKILQGRERTKAVIRVRRKVGLILSQNDFLVFGMRSLGFTKAQMREVFYDYEAFIRDNRLREWFEFTRKFDVPRKVLVTSRPTLHGHDFLESGASARIPAPARAEDAVFL